MECSYSGRVTLPSPSASVSFNYVIIKLPKILHPKVLLWMFSLSIYMFNSIGWELAFKLNILFFKHRIVWKVFWQLLAFLRPWVYKQLAFSQMWGICEQQPWCPPALFYYHDWSLEHSAILGPFIEFVRTASWDAPLVECFLNHFM